MISYDPGVRQLHGATSGSTTIGDLASRTRTSGNIDQCETVRANEIG